MSPLWLAPILPKLLELNLAAGAGILLVLALRRPILNLFGAGAAYGLWLAPLLAALAVLAPARFAPAPIPPPALLEPVSAAASLSSLAALAARTGEPVSHPLRLDPNLALAAWLAGALIGLAWLARSHLRFLAAERAGRAGPAVTGLWRPRIVLPADFEARFEPAERAAILAHERAHLRGQDSRINALAAVLTCFAWFNPLAHLAVRRLRLDQDLARDEAALAERPGQARLYAATLLKAQLQGQGSPLACAFGTHPLAERVALAARGRFGPIRRLGGLALVLGLGLGAAAAAWAAQPARPVAAPLVPVPLVSTPLVPTPLAVSSDRTPRPGAPTPRDVAPIPAAARTPAARQLLADAVPPSPQGETMITTSPAHRRLAAAAVLALGLGTGSAQAAAIQPPPPPPPAPVRATPPIPPAPPRPAIAPREVPPPPVPPRPVQVSRETAPLATLLLPDGTRIDCSAGSGQCIEKLASLMKVSALSGDASARASVAQVQALKAQSDANRAEIAAQVQAAKAQADASRTEARATAEAQVQAIKAQIDASRNEVRASPDVNVRVSPAPRGPGQ